MLISHGLFHGIYLRRFRSLLSLCLQVRNEGYLTVEFKSLKPFRMKFHAHLFSYDDNNADGREDTPAINTVCYCFMSLGSE